MSMAHQVITLVAATDKLFMNVKTENVKKAQEAMLEYFDREKPEIIKELEDKKVLTDELHGSITDAAKEFFANRPMSV